MEPKNHIQYFKLVDINTNKSYGRYVGETPKQAANKAFINIMKNKNNELIEGIPFYIKESTRGSDNKKIYKFVGSRVKLGNYKALIVHSDDATHDEYEESDSEDEKDDTKTISNFSLKIEI